MLAVVVVGAVVLLTGGDDGRSEEEQAYVDAIADYMVQSQSDDEELVFGDEQAECFAGAAVDAIGVEALQEAATPEEIRAAAGSGDGDSPLDPVDINRSQAEEVFDETNDCVRYKELMLDSVRADGDVTEAQIACLDDALTDEIVRDYMVATFTEEEAALDQARQALSTAAAPCENA